MKEQFINLIKEYFKDRKATSIWIKTVQKFFELYPQIKLQCQKILLEHPAWDNLRNIIIGYIFDLKLRVCQTCR